MKRVVISIFYLMHTFSLYSQNEIQFINYQWGSTMDFVIMNEGLPNNEYEINIQNIRLVYNNKVTTLYPCNVNFEFFENKLHMVYYDFYGNYNIKELIEIYLFLRTELINTYNEYLYSHDVNNETDEQRIYRLIQSLQDFSIEMEQNNIIFDYIIFHRTFWLLHDTSIEIVLCYNYRLNNFQINIYFFAEDYFRNIYETWH